MKPHASIQWQIGSKIDNNTGQVKADRMIDEMLNDPYQIRVPHDWEIFTKERLSLGGKPYCEECTDYLRQKFQT